MKNTQLHQLPKLPAHHLRSQSYWHIASVPKVTGTSPPFPKLLAHHHRSQSYRHITSVPKVTGTTPPFPKLLAHHLHSQSHQRITSITYMPSGWGACLPHPHKHTVSFKLSPIKRPFHPTTWRKWPIPKCLIRETCDGQRKITSSTTAVGNFLWWQFLKDNLLSKQAVLVTNIIRDDVYEIWQPNREPTRHTFHSEIYGYPLQLLF